MTHFTCDLVSFLEEDPLGKNIAKIFAQYRTITSKWPLSHRVRIEGVPPVRFAPVYFYVFQLYNQLSSHSRVALEMDHAANSRPCAN
jgi:hypothetical protein